MTVGFPEKENIQKFLLQIKSDVAMLRQVIMFVSPGASKYMYLPLKLQTKIAADNILIFTFILRRK